MNEKKPIYFYMANLGSEVGRMFVWQERGDSQAAHAAFRRSIDIIEQIEKQSDRKLSEVALLKDTLTQIDHEPDANLIDRGQMQAYFMPFALRVMSERKIS